MKKELYLVFGDELKKFISEIFQQEIIPILQDKLKYDQEDDEFITFNETLRLLKISRSTLFKYMKDKIIPYTKLRGRVLFSKKAILKTIESKK